MNQLRSDPVFEISTEKNKYINTHFFSTNFSGIFLNKYCQIQGTFVSKTQLFNPQTLGVIKKNSAWTPHQAFFRSFSQKGMQIFNLNGISLKKTKRLAKRFLKFMRRPNKYI